VLPHSLDLDQLCSGREIWSIDLNHLKKLHKNYHYIEAELLDIKACDDYSISVAGDVERLD